MLRIKFYFQNGDTLTTPIRGKPKVKGNLLIAQDVNGTMIHTYIPSLQYYTLWRG